MMIFFLPAVTQENKVSVEQEVDLFNSCAYEELLFGPINMEGKKLTHSDGPLLKAIHNNCPLTIYNPPDSDRFKQLIHQVNVEKKLLINGRMQKIPENVIIKTASRPFSTTLPKNVIITMEDSDEEQKDSLERIYLGVHNIHEVKNIYCQSINS